MPQQIDAALKEMLLSAEFRPAITLWNRLEGRPRAEEFDRSLRAEIRDPLWMLTRQWQFGEFKGEDAGSAVKARVQLSVAPIDRFAVASESSDSGYDKAVPYDVDLPLEAEVERERLWDDGPDASSSHLGLRAQLGRHWTRLLKSAGLASPALQAALLERFGFEDVGEKPSPSEAEQLELAHIRSDAVSWQILEAVKGTLPDGRRLLEAIEQGAFDTWVDERFDSATGQPLKDLSKDFRSWFYRLYSQPQTSAEDAWAPPYLEYQFAVSAPHDEDGQQRDVLVAEQYHQGRLDWYAFDIGRETRLEDLPETPFPESGFTVRPPVAFLPAQVEFNGMPNVRWWEFEDRRIDFGSIRAGTTDLPLLMLAEFGLIFGNDWSVIPYDLDVGVLAETKGIVVTDVFGVRTLIRAAGVGEGMDWQQWSIYKLAAQAGRGPVDSRLFLPPAVAKIQESAPIERLILARDEVSNMVWGIEERIPGVSGNGVEGFEAGTALARYFLHRSPPLDGSPQGNDAKIRYVLGGSVPENWIPFIATRKPGSNRQIRLQRAAAPRLTDAIPDSRVEPRGRILRTGLDDPDGAKPYFIHEEEVPRAGAVVTRAFQRARWFDGKTFVWLGRRKETGRGEGASGLVFDQILPVQHPANGNEG